MERLLGETSTDETGAFDADHFAIFFKNLDTIDAVQASTAATLAYEVPHGATTSTLEGWDWS